MKWVLVGGSQGLYAGWRSNRVRCVEGSEALSGLGP